MAKWVKGSVLYRQFTEKKGIVATMSFMEAVRKSNSVYNVFRIYPIWGAPYFGVVFGDQVDLLKYVRTNDGNLFMLRHLGNESIMQVYYVELGGQRIEVRTIAEALVLARQP